MSRRPFRVGRSRTGLGLFATKPIQKGQFLAYYRGPKITAAESEKREARGNRYLYEINSRWVIDGSPRYNIARYGNHSCRPNAETDVRGHKVLVRAIKNIEPGEEITYHYGKNYFDIYLRPIGCKCLKCIEKRRKERSAKIAETKRRKAREARKAARLAATARTAAEADGRIAEAGPTAARPRPRRGAAEARERPQRRKGQGKAGRDGSRQGQAKEGQDRGHKAKASTKAKHRENQERLKTKSQSRDQIESWGEVSDQVWTKTRAKSTARGESEAAALIRADWRNRFAIDCRRSIGGKPCQSPRFAAPTSTTRSWARRGRGSRFRPEGGAT